MYRKFVYGMAVATAAALAGMDIAHADITGPGIEHQHPRGWSTYFKGCGLICVDWFNGPECIVLGMPDQACQMVYHVYLGEGGEWWLNTNCETIECPQGPPAPPVAGSPGSPPLGPVGHP